MRAKAIYAMGYRAQTLCDPKGPIAAVIAQEIADRIERCGYPKCRGRTVGCAVHEVILKTESGYEDGSQFLPVCRKHKLWEFQKVKDYKVGVQPWGWEV